MSIISWLKAVTHGGDSVGLVDSDSMTFAEGEEMFSGLNMKDALDAHMQWTQRLEGKINGQNDEPLDVGTVASDCECTLGKWIYGTARQQFGEEADYKSLRHIHAEFHLKAGEILNNLLHGKGDRARANLKELRYHSGNVQLALVRLYSHAQH